jgi:hypothetical protein
MCLMLSESTLDGAMLESSRAGNWKLVHVLLWHRAHIDLQAAYQ